MRYQPPLRRGSVIGSLHGRAQIAGDASCALSRRKRIAFGYARQAIRSETQSNRQYRAK
jgi:hypothetical protein